MIITCPSCETRFNVNPAQLLPHGRTVKCAKCGHLWTERPPAAARRAPEREVERAVAVDDLPPTAIDEVEDLYSRTRGRRTPRTPPPALHEGRRSGRGQLVAWLVLLALVGGVAVGAVVARETVVAVWPPANRLFELAGYPVEKIGEGLEIRNITSSQKLENEQPTLVVAGEIVNLTAQEIPIPKMRGSLLDVRQRVVFVWDFTPKEGTIRPGQVVPFDTSVSAPPASARRIAVAFFEDAPSATN